MLFQINLPLHFIRCLKRFVARRGLPRRFISDNEITSLLMSSLRHLQRLKQCSTHGHYPAFLASIWKNPSHLLRSERCCVGLSSSTYPLEIQCGSTVATPFQAPLNPKSFEPSPTKDDVTEQVRPKTASSKKADGDNGLPNWKK